MALVLFLVHNCVHDSNAPQMVDIESPSEPKTIVAKSDGESFEECSKITRSVLITHCGSCHQSSLDTHKAGAIAIFDLDKGANWHTDLAEEHLHGIAKRTQNKSTISEQQKEAISIFLELKELELTQ
ncbi:MAG: hypothetical protein EX254_08750 [Flavobacteriaceae bacterium]|nr:MAG: hypothetical protein EX254_08750 [Flavobacteriaceae bacterium]